jgi:hypothetical protein
MKQQHFIKVFISKKKKKKILLNNIREMIFFSSGLSSIFLLFLFFKIIIKSVGFICRIHMDSMKLIILKIERMKKRMRG